MYRKACCNIAYRIQYNLLLCTQFSVACSLQCTHGSYDILTIFSHWLCGCNKGECNGPIYQDVHSYIAGCCHLNQQKGRKHWLEWNRIMEALRLELRKSCLKKVWNLNDPMEMNLMNIYISWIIIYILKCFNMYSIVWPSISIYCHCYNLPAIKTFLVHDICFKAVCLLKLFKSQGSSG